MHLIPLQPQDIGLILSYKCQCACTHCIYNCSPQWQDWAQPETVDQALNSMLYWQHSFQVHITGGEPFLNFSLLHYSIEKATQLGINRYLETNAGWCTNENNTREKFSLLRQAGLQAILISCSPFHAEKIPPKSTQQAIEVGIEIFGFHRTMVYQSNWLDMISSFGVDQPSPLDNYITEYGVQAAGELFWQGYGLMPGGRSAYRLGHLTAKHPPEYFRGQKCHHELLFAPHSHMDLYGNFIPGFCGGISLGNWRELDTIIENYKNSLYPPLINILVNEGVYGLYKFAKADYGYSAQEEGYVGKCHLCVDIRRHLVKSEEPFEELKPAYFYEMF